MNTAQQQPHLGEVDWSKIPAPEDDGGARHLEGSKLPDIALRATGGEMVRLGDLKGRMVLFAYPRTGTPGAIGPVDDWDMIPGARGCTPQACSFRDLFKDLRDAGVDHVFGVSTQTNEYQREMATRLHLPFPVLSDADLELASALRLPTMNVADETLLKRLAIIADDGVIVKVFYPVFPPDRNAADVLEWLSHHSR